MTLIDQKVREKLQTTLEECWRTRSRGLKTFSEDMADAILQSPELRVMLVESRYYILRSQINDDFSVYRRHAHEFDEWLAKFPSEAAANDYIAWFNSKEPKS